MINEQPEVDKYLREFPTLGPQAARMTFHEADSPEDVKNPVMPAVDIYAGIVAAQERTADLRRHHGWDKKIYEKDVAQTYAEMYLTPALSLLHEGLKIVEPAGKSARNFEGGNLVLPTNQSPFGEAVLGILADGCMAINPTETLDFISKIKNKKVKAEALAKLSQGDRALAGRARALAGKNVDTLMVVGKYAEDGESLGRALSGTYDIEKVLQIAALGYRPALEKAKALLLHHYRKNPHVFSISSNEAFLTPYSKETTETIQHYGGLDGLVMVVADIEQKIANNKLLSIADGKGAKYLSPKEAVDQEGDWQKRMAVVMAGKSDIKAPKLRPIDDFSARLVNSSHQTAPPVKSDLTTRVDFPARVSIYTKIIEEIGPGAVEAILYEMSGEKMYIGPTNGDVRYLALAQAVKQVALQSDRKQVEPAV